jgi:simple sugar transport system permease protein
MPSSNLAFLGSWGKRNPDMAVLPFLLVGVIVVLSIATEGNFLSAGNFGSLASQLPELGLLSLAMMVTMITAGINLSIISTANLVGVVMVLIFKAALLGLFNGYLIAYLKITPVLATLGTMILYEGLTLAITRGYVLSGTSPEFVAISQSTFFGVPYLLIVFVVIAVVVAYVLERRPFGRQLHMLGSNATATRFSAVNVNLVILKTYMLSSLLAGVAAVIMLSRFNSANARQGTSLLLVTVLIAVLGGTDPDGGFGKVLGLVLALLIMQCITSGLNLLGISSFLTLAIWGGLLIAVIAYRLFQNRTRG